MKLECPHCRRVLEFSDERPSFCAYCGQPLSSARTASVPEVVPEPATVPPVTPLPDRNAAPTVAYVPGSPVSRTQGPGGEGHRFELQVIGGYRLIREIGSGGMGTVYEAEDSATGRRVALKLISEEFSCSKDAVDRFRQEGQLASRIAHPRCVFVLAADEQAGRSYIVMELMPGATLKDLVDKQGPLPPEQAVAKILDVIEGLQEAHRLGVIHRDVKPSNCFLTADDRVKIGDFGLSKSLVGDSHLTRTGAFVGTPLFASPEQIRRDAVDQQTDVYSVAATLYFLLTGRAPFEGGDAAATLARIVGDPPPPMRNYRPEILLGLDRVVLRGLERHRERRWRSLDELREALLPFVPGHLSIGGMGVRFGAYLIDYFFLSLIPAPLVFAMFSAGAATWVADRFAALRPGAQLGNLLSWLLYFALPEGIWGCSLGKWLLRLRVCARAGERPGLPRALLRFLIFYGLLHVEGLVASAVAAANLPRELTEQQVWESHRLAMWFATFLPLVGLLVGLAVLLLPMRRRNGYRGTHEFLSGTRVVRLPWPQRRRTYRSIPLDQGLAPPDSQPAQIASFVVRGTLRSQSADGDRVLLGDDPVLGRTVWIWLRLLSDPPLSSIRRDLSRAARLRWVACGQEDQWQWDAFVASAGCPLPDVIRAEGKLSWADGRPILEQLTDELMAAQQEGILPKALALDQIWVQPNGAIQLLDFPLNGTATLAAAPAAVTGRGLPVSLLAQASVLMFEGRIPAPNDKTPTLQAPLPQHAAKIMNRLLASEPGYQVADFKRDLLATADRPTEVSRQRRAPHLAVLLAFLFPGLWCMLLAGWFLAIGDSVITYAQIREEEEALKELDAGAAGHFLCASASLEPFMRTRGAIQLGADLLLDDQLRQDLDRNRLRRQARLNSLTWYTRQYVLAAEQNIETQLKTEQDKERIPDPSFPQAGFRALAEHVAQFENPLSEGKPFFKGWLLICLLPWPALWVLWAFLARGGLSFRIMGISLVRSNGRPALRIQCAWRALLVWLPVTALLG